MYRTPDGFYQEQVMLQFFQKKWFLIGLLVMISGGLAIGYSKPETAVSLKEAIPTSFVTSFVLFLMAFSLDSAQLKSSFRSPGPVVWASLCNFVLVPLLGLALLSLQLTIDFRIGLMIAVSAPCTLAGASVWTRKAGGNDAVSLLTTLATNLLCFVVTPFWLNLGTSQSVELDVQKLIWQLVLVVLIPTLLGQIVRRPMASFAKRVKTPVGVIAQSCLLLLVFMGACSGGLQIHKSDVSEQIAALAVVWLSCIACHLVALWVANSGSRLLGFDRRDRIATAFAGSQKTLPIGVYLATDPSAFGGAEVINGMPVPFAVFPMLMFHASQLFIDTFIADRFVQTQPEEPVTQAAPS